MFIFTETSYQLFRNRGRSVLLAIVSALLCGCIAFYLGNITASQRALDTLNDTTPAEVHLISHDCSRTTNLLIAAWRYDILEENGVHDIRATSQARGSLRPGEGFAADTSILALTRRDAAKIYSDEPFTFAEGYDSSLLEGSEALCILDADYARSRGFSIGDTIEISIQLVQYDWDVVPVYIDVPDASLKVAGTYRLDTPTEHVADMYVPAAWLRAHAEAAGKSFAYNTLEGPLADSMKLNSFKENVLAMGFLQPLIVPDNSNVAGPPPPPEDHTTGDRLYFDDEQFIKTAERLGSTVRTFKAFMLPFFLVIVCLVTLAIFLVLRGSRLDMAISCSLGRPKPLIGMAHIMAALAAEAVGAVLSVPVMVRLGGLGLGLATAIAGAFLVCAMLGDTIGLWALLRFDALQLLLATD